MKQQARERLESLAGILANSAEGAVAQPGSVNAALKRKIKTAIKVMQEGLVERDVEVSHSTTTDANMPVFHTITPHCTYLKCRCSILVISYA